MSDTPLFPAVILRRFAAVALVVLAIGCSGPQSAAAPDDTTSEAEWRDAEEAYASFLAAVGGPQGLISALSGSEEAVRARLAPYGIGVGVAEADPEDGAGGPAADNSITGCPQYFASTDRNQWWILPHAGGDEHHYIDASGRASRAVKQLPLATPSQRSANCQATVGNWGVPPTDYQGGHLIGYQLGGWGKRANLVPQNGNFNGGNWAQIENALAACNTLPGGTTLTYYVELVYPNATALTPSQFYAQITFSTGAQKTVNFTNTTGGGPGGTATRQALVNWLQANGC